MINAISFLEEWSWRGQWWRPGSDTRYHGTLIYRPEQGLVLELVGILPNRDAKPDPRGWVTVGVDDETPEDLHGISMGRKVTLLECHSQRSRGGIGSLFGGPQGEEDFAVRTALFGVHMEDSDLELFDVAQISLDGLTTWSGEHVLSAPRTPGGRYEYDRVVASFPENPQTAIIDDDHYSLVQWTHGPNIRPSSDGLRTSFSQTTCLKLEPSEPRSFGRMREMATEVANIVSFARRSHSGPISFQLHLSDAPEGRPGSGTVDVLYRRHLRSDAEERGTFTAQTLGFQAILETWFAKWDDLGNVTKLLQATWDDGWYLESAVLTLATAAESLGSSYELPRKMPELEYKSMIASILENVPAEHQGWIRGAFGGMNGPSLRTRIGAVADHLPETVRSRLLPAPEVWARKFVTVRNNLSHRGSAGVSFEELASIHQVTSAVLYLAVLVELGLTTEQLENALEFDGYLRYACVRSARDLT